MANKIVVFTLTGILILDNHDDAYHALEDTADTIPDYVWGHEWRNYREVSRRISMWTEYLREIVA